MCLYLSELTLPDILQLCNCNMHHSSLTLCRSYLKPYCMGRKTAFFQQAFKFTYYTRKWSPLQEKKIITIKLKKTE